MRNTSLWFSDSQRNFYSPPLQAGKGVEVSSEKILHKSLYKIFIFSMFAVITDLEVIVLVKAVKWHQNTAAAKAKLNICVIWKTQITFRLRKKQKTSPYHSILSSSLKVRWNCLMKTFCLRGKKVGVFQWKYYGLSGKSAQTPGVSCCSDLYSIWYFNSSRWPLLQDDLPSIRLLWPLGHKLSIGCCCHSVRHFCTLSSKE